MLRAKDEPVPGGIQPARLPSPSVEGIRRRFDLGLVCTGLLYSCGFEALERSLGERFPDHPLESVDLAAMAGSLDMDMPGFIRLHRRITELAAEKRLILIHGYDRKAMPHCILLFDYLERESELTTALSASGSFLVVAWTADEKERFLSERLSLPGADGGFRDFSFVMHNFAKG